MLRTLLVYPPFVTENRAFPPLSLPALTAYLKQRGFPVVQIDANISFYQYLCTPASLDALERNLLLRRAALKSVQTLHGMEQHCMVEDGLNAWLPYVRRELEKCGGNIASLDGIPCLHLLDRLTTLIGLERDIPKPYIELTSDELIAEVSEEPASLLRDFFRDEVVPSILAAAPDVIGMSLMVEQQLYPALVLAYLLKTLIPHVHIVLGGGLVSAVADKIGLTSTAVFSLVDSFVCFDGEHALIRLLGALSGEQDMGSVNNLIYCDKAKNQIMRTAIAETGGLDDLPEPDFEGIDFAKYTRPIVPYYVSKGCAYGRCAYCSDPAYSSARNRSPQRAAQEIKSLVDQYHPQTVLFVDSYIHPKYMEPLAHELIERKIETRWVTQTRMDRFLTTSCIETLAASGCSELWFGMETINERMIRLIRKGSKRSIIMRILDDCCRCGIKVTLNCMIGFPTETREEADQTIAFIDELGRIYPTLMFKCNTGFVFVPRLSPFGQTPERFGISVLEEFEWSPRLEWIPPEWRYEDRFLRLDGQMFEKSYRGAQQRRDELEGIDLRSLGPKDIVYRAPGARMVDVAENLCGMWSAYFKYQLSLTALQRERRLAKADARTIVDAQLRSDSAIQAALHAPTRVAYLVENGAERRMLPLNEIYSILLDEVDGCVQVHDVIERFTARYKGFPPQEVATACMFGLTYLYRRGLVRVLADEPVVDSIEVPAPWERRWNLGQSDIEVDEDAEPSHHPSQEAPNLVQIAVLQPLR